MSLCSKPIDIDLKSFPRVSGDEPALEIIIAHHKLFSPRERG